MYTLVQHSGFVVSGKMDFKHAVELRSLCETSVEAVREAGGLIFETYSAASSAEFNENYPPDVHGMIPRVSGSFSQSKVQGQRIYIPTNLGDD